MTKEDNQSKGTKMTDNQIRAVKYVNKCAKLLQKIYPAIAQDYRMGLSHREISLKYDVKKMFDCVQEDISIGIVRVTLCGNLERHFGPVFEGLLPNEEYAAVSKEHQVVRGGEQAENQRLTGTGIFGMSTEERAAVGRKSGKNLYANKSGMFARSPEEISKDATTAAKRCYELGAGVHALTHEQLSIIGKKAGKIGGKIGGKKVREQGLGIFALSTVERSRNSRDNVTKRGQTIWERGEIEYVFSLLETGNYKYKGRTSVKGIAEEVNRTWHENKAIRTANSVANIIKLKRRDKLRYLD